MASEQSPIGFSNGSRMKNRFMLAPLTNLQSHPDGTLSDDEIGWLTLRAQGGFGAVMTAAAHVQAVGQGFPGQLGVFSDTQLPELSKLASQIKAHDALAIVQLHHAGLRSPKELIGCEPVSCSANEKFGARALSTAEVEQLCTDFIAAAVRSKRAGFDGVELHGAHNYIIAQFLSATFNQRDDHYGGSLENRYRLLFDIIEGVRAECGNDFLLGVRLTPERHGIELLEAVETAKALFADARIDFLDMSLWDVFKQPHEEAHQHKPLLQWFTELERGSVRLGVAGKIYGSEDVRFCLEQGVDFVMPGRAAILHHDFPQRVEADAGFRMANLPVTRDYLRSEAVGDAFIEYLSSWPGFVA